MIDMPHMQQRTTPPITKSMHKRKLHAKSYVTMSTGHVNEYSLVFDNDQYIVRTPDRNIYHHSFIQAVIEYGTQVEECKGFAAFFKGQLPTNDLQMHGYIEASKYANVVADIELEIEQRYDGETAWKI